MNIKELIEELKKYADESLVFVFNENGDCLGSIQDVAIHDKDARPAPTVFITVD